MSMTEAEWAELVREEQQFESEDWDDDEDYAYESTDDFLERTHYYE